MTPLPILQRGSCEPFKAGVHGASLVLFWLMGLYNAAAWINRRERHLAVNALVYAFGVAWEQRLVRRHLRACRGERRVPAPGLLPRTLAHEARATMPLASVHPSDDDQPLRAA